MIFFRRALVIFFKDLRTEWRTKQRVVTMAFFSLLILLVFNFALKIGGAMLHEIGAGVLWSTLVFANLLGLGRVFDEEKENRAIDALLITPGDRSAIYFGKLLAHFVSLFLVSLFVLPFFCVFFNISFGMFLLPLCGVLALGSLCFTCVGTLYAVLSYNLRLRELMLSVLLVPMLLPALISIVEATNRVFSNNYDEVFWTHVKILVVFAIIFIAVSHMLFEYIIEE
ncbi:MAG: heme exporter protein CcmB [Candidatus Latescibacterota bacterium]|nr:heme exporter protein CcmB [Candidatus Latescibacterota bacterium]